MYQTPSEIQQNPCRAMHERLRQIQESLRYEFGTPQLLQLALTHPSYSAEREPPPPDNQRLEFLGDAVLQLIASDLLFERYPGLDEGKLTKVRSAVTKESTLAHFARQLDIGSALLLGKGEMKTGGAERPSNLADTFEAVLGAVYLDGGLEAARVICERFSAEMLADPHALLATENPKGALQELVQELYQTPPVYEVLNVSGPDHLPRFSVRVLVDGQEVATASAGSRRRAERGAAEMALKKLAEHEPA